MPTPTGQETPTELLLGLACVELSSWPTGTCLLLRKERHHHLWGQLIFTDADNHRAGPARLPKDSQITPQAKVVRITNGLSTWTNRRLQHPYANWPDRNGRVSVHYPAPRRQEHPRPRL